MKHLILPIILLASLTVGAADGTFAESQVSRESFRIRDPFVLVAEGKYWLYESKPWFGGTGVSVRTSDDLKNWTEPHQVMSVPTNVACTAVWAPEVHRYDGAYWLFATITEKKGARPIAAMADGVADSGLVPRGTWVFKAMRPEGPFLPVKEGPVPPKELMTLDGTLYVEDGTPYMVYCHEWCQLANGTMEYAPLKPGFAAFAAKPVRLFDAKSAMPGAGYVTDGPYFYRSEKSGRLYLIWSNFIEGHGYCVFVRSAANGKLAGPWTKDEILYDGNGGHAMIFKALDGRLMLTLHQPNDEPKERMRLYQLMDDGARLILRRD